MSGFVLLVIGAVGGIILTYIAMWNYVRGLEDELMQNEELLNTAVQMLREERKDRAEWHKVGNGSCDSIDFSKKW